MQHHISEMLRNRGPKFNFVALFSARLRTILARSSLPHDPLVLGRSLEKLLSLAAAVLSPGLLVATIRLGTNAWATSHGFGNAAEDCPFCLAPGGDRISHYIQCGGIFVWVEDNLPGLHWPIDDVIGRVSAFFGGSDLSPEHSAATAIMHDLIHSAAKSARRNAVNGSSALTARLRAVMSGSSTVFNLMVDLNPHL
jgi:hypothetical protein